MQDLPVVIRLPMRLILVLAKFTGKLVLGFVALLLGFFGIAILAAYPQLPAHEHTYILWGVGILLAALILGSMAWMWIQLRPANSNHPSRKNSPGQPALDLGTRGPIGPIKDLVRTSLDRLR